MIERLMILEEDDQFALIEPVTSQVLTVSPHYEFVRDFSFGFLEGIAHRYFQNMSLFNNLRYTDCSFGYIMGAKLANQVCLEYTCNQQ